jgi:hypothetical protein
MRIRAWLLVVSAVLLVGCSASLCAEDENAEMAERLKKYPVPLAAVDRGRLVVRAATEFQELFSGLGWRPGKHEEAPGEEGKPVFFSAPIQKDGKTVQVRVGIDASADVQTQRTKEESYRRFVSSSRPSTWSGSIAGKLEMPGAAFVAYHEPSKDVPNRVFAAWANVQLLLVAVRGDAGAFASDEELSGLGKSFAALLASPEEAKVDAASDKTVSLKVETRTAKSAVLTWSAGDALKGCWIRLDAAAGTLSMDPATPGRVTLAELPPEGTQVTAYAITPDGSKWHRSKIAVAPASKGGDTK